MREVLEAGYERTLSVIGWSALIVAVILIGLSLAWHVEFSPFSRRGASPDDNDRLGLLTLDGIRWVLLLAAGVVVNLRRAPGRKAVRPIAWVAEPLTGVMGILLLGAVATGAWFAWMARLPGGSWEGDVILCGVYFAIPAALTVTLGLFLERRLD